MKSRTLALGLLGLCLGASSWAKTVPWSDTKTLTIIYSYPQEVGARATTTGLTLNNQIVDNQTVVGYAITNGSQVQYAPNFIGLVPAPGAIVNDRLALSDGNGNYIYVRPVLGDAWQTNDKTPNGWMYGKEISASGESGELVLVADGDQTVASGEYSIGMSATYRTA